MESWNYKNILNKIKKIEKAMKRLEIDGFNINKNELRNIIVANKINDNDKLNYLKIHTELNDLLIHLSRLEKLDEYYKWVRFKINTDKNIRLFLDTYVNNTLDIMQTLNTEIKEYGVAHFKKFANKFYNLVYFLIKLEIGVNGESEIGREMFNHSGHIYCLRELVFSDLNRINFDDAIKRDLKDSINEKKYDSFVNVMVKLIKEDRKIKKLLNLSDNEIERLGTKRDNYDQATLLEIKRLVKKED